MKLLSCEITGFGRLHELHIDFKNGLNAFLEDNGWGKTSNGWIALDHVVLI